MKPFIIALLIASLSGSVAAQDEPLSIEGLALRNARLLVAGAPERSMISIRMHSSDLSAMPPQRRVVDTVGAAVVDAWIRSLTSCR